MKREHARRFTDPEGRRWLCDVTVDYDPVFSAGSVEIA
jgi:hypothetical protein